MKRFKKLLTAGPAMIALGLCLAVAPGLQAQVPFDADLWTETEAPETISTGSQFTVTVGYGNNGPQTARSAYVTTYFVPGVGLDVFVDDTVNGDGTFWTALYDSTEGTDTLGSQAVVSWDDNYCEEALIQVQRADEDQDPNPIEGLDPGVSASYTYETTIPMENAASSAVTITEPASIAQTWFGNITNPLNAAGKNGFSRGSCDQLVGSEDEEICSYIDDNCFGTRVSLVESTKSASIEAEFELVNDGTADPTLGCEELVDFTPGNVAVLRRGTCEFGTKSFNAEQAGAIAVFMVNTDGCGDFPASDQCTLGMLAGDLGGLTTIPTIQIAQADGEPVITALEGGATVRGIYGDSSVFTAQTSAWLSDDSDTDPDDTNDDSVSMAAVSEITNPPVAAFTFDPAAPTTGMAVQFTDTSTGAPTAWAWDFGDGGTNSEQNPMYTYASADTFTVSLMVTNAGGSDTASQDISVTLGANLTESYLIPAAALAAGAEGSFFQTDVDINNSGSTDASFAFQWLPRGTDNSSPTQSATFTLAAGASTRYENVLAEVFGAEPDIAGALAVVSNTADLKIGSRTYNLSTAKASGTFGQALPGVPANELIMQGETKRIIFMSENDDLRANLGCANAVNDSVRVIVNIFDDTGAMLETKNMDLAPMSNDQFNRIFQAYAPTNGYVDVVANKAGAAFYCYGSVLDNGSNDPTSILPTAYGADAPFVTYFVPAAALAAGAEGSFFQTDVDINNAGTAMATYQFLWLPRGADNSDPAISESFTLAAGASVRYENVLVEVFGAEPDVSGAIAITADSASLGVMSRTYNLPTAKVAGTFGQAIPGIPSDNLIMQGETRRIIFMSENDDLRANLGCVNGVNDSVRIAIAMYDDEGNLLEMKNMDLGPWSNDQFNRLFRAYSPTNGYADISASKAGAMYYCYGSVLDNGSNDPTTILPQ